MKSFGETIRELREEKGLLIRHVAALLDVDPSLLSRVEGGVARPTREQVLKLAGILKTDEDKLIVLYLSERVIYQLKDEDLAIEAIMVAEKRIRYNAANSSKRSARGGAARKKT